MEYTIQRLSKLAGVSSRTLRYYDTIGLLKPKRINSSGYRIYGAEEVDQLQMILFYKELGFPLEEIKAILQSKEFRVLNALKEHHDRLIQEREQLERLIQNVEKTIASKERSIPMSDKEKFEGFKKKLVEENEKTYGKEAREKYGDQVVEDSNRKMLNMTQEQYNAFIKLGEELNQTLVEAFQMGDPRSETAKRAVELHKQWLSFTWKSYSKEAHRGLAQMYVDDERFTAYYDQLQPGLAVFLRDAIFAATE